MAELRGVLIFIFSFLKKNKSKKNLTAKKNFIILQTQKKNIQLI